MAARLRLAKSCRQRIGHASLLVVDLEVLTLLRLGDLGDRRALGEASSTPDAGHLPTAPRSLYPCAYVQHVRLLDAGRRLQGAAVVALLRQACGPLLLEAHEVADPEPSSERQWRIVLASPGDVLDDRDAYKVYQAARALVAERLGAELR